MKINELLGEFSVYTTNEEAALLEKFHRPVKISSLPEHERFRVEGMIRKSLLTKIGFEDPMVVINAKTTT
jgi:hypothetical protein